MLKDLKTFHEATHEEVGWKRFKSIPKDKTGILGPYNTPIWSEVHK